MRQPLNRISPFSLIKQKRFFSVWMSGFLIGTTRNLDMLAVAIFIFESTASALAVAFAMFLRMLPLLLFGALAGTLAEKIDRRGILIFGLVILGVIYIFLAFLAWRQLLDLWVLMAGVFLGGVFWTFEMPIRRTMIAEIAKLENLAVAMGLDTGTNNVTRMLGPFTGGFLYEVSGLHGTMFLGGVLYFLSALILLTVRETPSPASYQESSIVQNLIEGISYVRSEKLIIATLAVTIAFNFFGFSCVSMIPVIAHEKLNLSAFPTGVLLSGEGAGALVGSLLVAFMARQGRFNKIYVFGATLYLLCICIFSMSVDFWISYIAMCLAGFGIAGFSAMQSAIILARAPPHMRTRIMGVLTACIGTSPFGVLIVGILVNSLSPDIAVMITSILGLSAMLAIVMYWPELLKEKNEDL